MFPMSDNGFESEMYQNIPTAALAFTMYTTTFGNGNFVIEPPMKGEINNGFPSVPYLSLEALLYQQQASNPYSAPVNTYSGSNTGQQVISATQTANDSTGTPRYAVGNQQS